MDRRCTTNARRYSPHSAQCQTSTPAAASKEAWAQKRKTVLHAGYFSRSHDSTTLELIQLVALADILNKGQHTLGNLWTDHLQEQTKQDLTDSQTLLPGAEISFRAASQQERAQRPTLVDQELLDGTTIDFKRSLVRLAWILQHAATLLPMAGDLQAVLNSETAGVSNIHSWGLMLPSSSRVSPVTYHSVVAVRYPNLCRLVNEMWELGSFASGGLPDKPPGFQLVLWDTDSKITGLVAADLETIVGHIIPDFSGDVGFADGLFVMTTATDHKNNLNRSGLKRDNARKLRVETIANSAGGTAQVAIVAQPSIGFLNGRFYADKSPTEDTEDCLGRITVGLTRSKSLTVLGGERRPGRGLIFTRIQSKRT